jgi:hypothetical protein
MRRVCLACLIGSFIVGGAALAAVPGDRAQLESFVCQRAIDPAARAIAVTAVMRPLPGTLHMAVKVVLLRRAFQHGRFAAVGGRDLGAWISPANPTLGQLPGDVWDFVKQVVNLPAAAYRLRIAFRWTGAGGRLLGTALRQTRVCLEPELRPDVAVQRVLVRRRVAAPHQALYIAWLRNLGRTASGPFKVQLSVAHKVFARKGVSQVAPRARLAVRFSAPACAAGAPVTVAADPDGVIDDANRANNRLTIRCPLPAGSLGTGR